MPWCCSDTRTSPPLPTPSPKSSRPVQSRLEAIDEHLVGFQRKKHLNPHALDLLPQGEAWLIVQMGGHTQGAADNRADDLLDAVGRTRRDTNVRMFDDPEHERQLWEVRESTLGATAHIPGNDLTWPGWEDSAVSPDRLGDYLRDLHALLDEYGYRPTSLYGHFGQGCVHCRIPFDLLSTKGVHQFRSFLERAADLVSSYGGSLSGEHGDGQARGELLSRMFGADIVRAFGEMKTIFDPDDRMNPGKIVEPYALDDHLRLGAAYDHHTENTYFRYPSDGGSFSKAVLRCVGVGKCRREGGGVMCPSYMVTRDEKNSTRGRARLLYEMLDGGERGGAIADGWRSDSVRDALDLCLACKGCKTDCPVNVDMATYKSEFLAHHYEHRLRPRSHYSMGWLPVWAALADGAPRVANRLARTPGLNALAKKAAGIDNRRDIPKFAPQSFQQWFRQRAGRETGTLGTVMLWPDTFTNHFDPQIAQSAVEILESAGWTVRVPEQRVCCGLTWISTGQLKTARRVITRTLDILRPHVRSGGLVLGLEPSCTAVFRSDATELFPNEPDMDRLRHQTVTLAELLREHTPGWTPPKITQRAIVQTHCHQHAVMGFEHDRALLEAMGVETSVLDSGCCGLAGNFGFETGHYEVSDACAERVLLPAVRHAGASDVILADGFSCRTQIAQGDNGGRNAVHLAQLILDAKRRDSAQPFLERAVGDFAGHKA